MKSIKILSVSYRNLPLYNDGKLSFDLTAFNRVVDPQQVFPLQRHLYTQKIEAIIGINASGKTSSLKLLYLAFAIVLSNVSLNEGPVYGREFLQDGVELTVLFAAGNKCYELTSVFGRKVEDKTKLPVLFFREEILKEKSLASVSSKRNLFDFTGTDVNITRRSGLPKEVHAVLRDDDSIAITVTKDSTTSLHQLISFTNMNVYLSQGVTPIEVLHVFDPMLDELKMESNGEELTYTVRFANQERPMVVHSPFGLDNIISSGTIKGQMMMMLIKDTLRTGGYLLVDEIENHMNKELIRMITEIFKNPEINRQGACLIFTTHYTEILDFIDRKDDIYVARRRKEQPRKLELLNYAHLVNRNDVKKSEVILSNYLGGTAPSYEAIRDLEDYLCRAE